MCLWDTWTLRGSIENWTPVPVADSLSTHQPLCQWHFIKGEPACDYGLHMSWLYPMWSLAKPCEMEPQTVHLLTPNDHRHMQHNGHPNFQRSFYGRVMRGWWCFPNMAVVPTAILLKGAIKFSVQTPYMRSKRCQRTSAWVKSMHTVCHKIVRKFSRGRIF